VKTIKFVWSGWELMAELDGSNNIVKSYVWGGGHIVGLLSIKDHVADKTYWPLQDVRGDIVGLVDSASGDVVETYEYAPYGKLVDIDGVLPARQSGFGVTSACGNTILHSGKYYDHEVGLYYFGYRYYDPQAMRWLNRDPLGEAGGLNLYQYCNGEPYNAIDPDGLFVSYITDPLADYALKKLEDVGNAISRSDIPFKESIAKGVTQAGGVSISFTKSVVRSTDLSRGLFVDLPVSLYDGVQVAKVRAQATEEGRIRATTIEVGRRLPLLGAAWNATEAWTGESLDIQEYGQRLSFIDRATRATSVVSEVAGVGAVVIKVGVGVRLPVTRPPSVVPTVNAPTVATPARPSPLAPTANGFEVVPQSYKAPYSQLSAGKRAALKEKVDNRTITKKEWAELNWNDRLSNARQQAVLEFWKSEKTNLVEGRPTARVWDLDQQAQLRSLGRVPGFKGHHRWGVKEYPHLARDPLNIQPLSHIEHLHGWHGGSYSGGSAVGVPLRPDLLIFLDD
jgi:RHS repeat-associated protein